MGRTLALGLLSSGSPGWIGEQREKLTFSSGQIRLSLNLPRQMGNLHSPEKTSAGELNTVVKVAIINITGDGLSHG
jgi:hypothetical protein